MKSKQLLLEPNENHIQDAFTEAKEIWSDYRDVFEHVGGVSTNPILLSELKFGRFCHQWGVARTIRKGLQDRFRCTFRDDPEFAAALDDETGVRLDQLHKNFLKPSFGTRNGTNDVISVMSKVAAFIRPAQFTAWDRFAKPGLNLTTGRPKSRPFQSYAEYLEYFVVARNGLHGQRISAVAEQSGEMLQKQLCFQNRVLDLYLMRCGGYEKASVKC